MSLERNPTTGLVIELFGPTVEYLTSPDDEHNDFCVLKGTIPPGGSVPLHSHADTEDFLIISGSVEGLRHDTEGYKWIRAEAGDYIMASISVTRLRVRSVFYLLKFFWYTLKFKKQAESASGVLGGRLMLEARRVFWTVTAWEGEAAMRAYRNSGAHMKAMPKLLDWCDEASYVHWEQESTELPSWAETHRRMVAEGKLSKVKNPSAAQLAKKIAEPRQGGSEGLRLKPVVKSG